MNKKEVTTAAVALSFLAISFTIAPLALATISASSYPFELTGRLEYVAPAGTPNPFGNAVGVVFHISAPIVQAEPFAWVPTAPYSTSPGHGL